MDRILCPVCQVKFVPREELAPDGELICPVCGARLQVKELEPEVMLERFPEEPEVEINDRIDRFADLRGFVFNENRELVVEGLLDKEKMFGDFYCPCRLENVPENVCPCLDTRSGAVKRNGRCLCGLFWLPEVVEDD